jgi:dUTP pyrophosphatase
MVARVKHVAVEIVRLPHGEGLPLPAYQTDHAAGMDLCAAVAESEPLILQPGARALVPTGLVIQLPDGHEAQIRPRSGLAFKNGVTILNSPGTIDCDYRGEIQVLLINLGVEAFEITRGMRIAQMIVAPVSRAAIAEIRAVSITRRGAGGFGSTGTKPGKMGKPVRAAGRARKTRTK